MVLTVGHVECILVSLLSVNGYEVARVQDLLPGLRREGLTDPFAVVAMDIAQVTAALTKAGYNKGVLNGRFADYIKGLMEKMVSGELDGLPSLLRENDRAGCRDLLLKVRGIGEHVASNVWTLCRLL